MKPLDARNEHYTLIDMDGYICLFTNMRLDRDTVPEDLYCYDVRDNSGDGEFAQVQKFVMVDHWGSILTKEPIPLDPQWHCYYPNRDADYFSDFSFTLDQFRNNPTKDLLAMVQTPSLASRMQEAHERASQAEGAHLFAEKSEQTRE